MIIWFTAIAVAFLAIGLWGWWAAPGLISRHLEGEARHAREVELRRGALGFLLLAAIGIWIVIELAAYLNR